MFACCWVAAGMQKGVLQFRFEGAALRWLTRLFRPDRDPHLAVGVSRLRRFVCTVTILNTTTALGFSRETEPIGYV